jgi:SET domain
MQSAKDDSEEDVRRRATTKLELPQHIGQIFYFTNVGMEYEDVKKLTHKDLTYIHENIHVSTDPSMVMAGRGLINGSNQTIERGQLLFVTPPTVAVDIQQVLRVYKGGGGGSAGNSSNGSRTRLEQIAETILLKQMKRHVKKHVEGGDESSDHNRIAASFLYLSNGDYDDERRYKPKFDSDPGSVLFKMALMGQHVVAGNSQPILVHRDVRVNTIEDDYLLKIIRHNAFGPDFHNYERMEREIDEGNQACYRRILAHYPFAAMINHSCTSNAQRVYAECNGTEVMIATASKPIKPGEEIVWSYIPPIVDYERRQDLLKSFGFECKCQRCQIECKVPHLDDLSIIRYLNKPRVAGLDMMTVQNWKSVIKKLDVALKVFDNATARSLRLGWTYFYLNYFNAALHEGGNEQDVIVEAMKLHFAFIEVHNACTEHLSILHMCYDLARTDENQMKKRKMFVEALRIAHTCRYSDLAFSSHKDDSTDRLRALLAHTKVVLRKQSGWQMAAETIDQQSKQMSCGDTNSHKVKVKAPII